MHQEPVLAHLLCRHRRCGAAAAVRRRPATRRARRAATGSAGPAAVGAAAASSADRRLQGFGWRPRRPPGPWQAAALQLQAPRRHSAGCLAPGRGRAALLPARRAAWLLASLLSRPSLRSTVATAAWAWRPPRMVEVELCRRHAQTAARGHSNTVHIICHQGKDNALR